MAKDVPVDLDRLVLFHDPHSGFTGAAVPLPVAAHRVANDLDGKTFPLREAVARLDALGIGQVRVHKDCVMLHVGKSGGVEHMWRVIRFRDP